MKRLFKWLVITLASIAGVIVALPVALFLADWAYRTYVPVYSAASDIEETGTTVQVDLYLDNPFGKAEYDRLLVVKSPRGTARYQMFPDWGGASRANLYLTERREVVVLGPTGIGYLVSLDPLTVSKKLPSVSAGWTYLGAFEFTSRYANGKAVRSFVFFTADRLRECIPSMGDFPPGPLRTEAYQRRC